MFYAVLEPQVKRVRSGNLKADNAMYWMVNDSPLFKRFNWNRLAA